MSQLLVLRSFLGDKYYPCWTHLTCTPAMAFGNLNMPVLEKERQ